MIVNIEYFVFIGVIGVNFLIDITAIPEVCPTSTSETTPFKLKDNLLCNYDGAIRPVTNHMNKTSVGFKLLLKFFEYDHHSSMLSIDAWLSIFWKDQHLTWEPNDYEGIRSLQLTTSDIWIPDLSVYNRKDQSSEPHVIGLTTCSVSYNGQVLCVPPVHIDALCVPKLRKYPFDSQNCTLRFGSWVHKGEEIDLKHVQPFADLEDLLPNGEWEILSTSSVKHPGNYDCCPNSTYPSINFSMIIKRMSRGHAASVLIPSLVAILLTFTSLSMSPLNTDRLPLCYVNVVAQGLHVEYVSWMVPLRGDEVPAILLFARDSLLLAAISVIGTLVCKWLMYNSQVAPIWISTAVSNLISTSPGQFLLLTDSSVKGVALAQNQEDGSTIISNSESNSNSQDWKIFGKIFDILFLFSYIIIYLVMVADVLF